MKTVYNPILLKFLGDVPFRFRFKGGDIEYVCYPLLKKLLSHGILYDVEATIKGVNVSREGFSSIQFYNYSDIILISK